MAFMAAILPTIPNAAPPAAAEPKPKKLPPDVAIKACIVFSATFIANWNPTFIEANSDAILSALSPIITHLACPSTSLN